MPEPSPSGTGIKPGPTHANPGDVEGDNTPLRDSNAEPDAPASAGPNPIGDGGGEGQGIDGDGDGPLNVDALLERFQGRAEGKSLKPGVASEYARGFRRFAEYSGLEGLTRRDLARRGKDLVLAYLATVPRPSWRYKLALLHTVWDFAVYDDRRAERLPWPINTRKDVGRLPKPIRGSTPPDTVVKAWVEALRGEKDPYLRLLWLCFAQFGWRPSHVYALRWQDIEYDTQGRPAAIRNDGSHGEFKTYAPLAARLAQDVAEALVALRGVHPNPVGEAPILPWRSAASGLVDRDRRLCKSHLWLLWHGLQDKWDLPHLRPKDLRHWVSTACRRAGLSKQASAYLMGHDPTRGGAMRDWYDNPEVQDALDEQGLKLPKGPLGLLEPPEVKLVEGLPPEAVALLREFLAGGVGTLEFANRLEVMRTYRSRVDLGP